VRERENQKVGIKGLAIPGSHKSPRGQNWSFASKWHYRTVTIHLVKKYNQNRENSERVSRGTHMFRGSPHRLEPRHPCFQEQLPSKNQ
jgi:DNA repair exonuclease SbcCD nuclease subunit